MTTAYYRRMFGADEAQIRELGGVLFLILGWKRTVDPSTGQWLKDGQPIGGSYTEHKVIASAKSPAGLLRSAKHYQRLQGMTVEQVLRERVREMRRKAKRRKQ